MSFQINALPRLPFDPLFSLDDASLRSRHARRVTADQCPGFPCRVSLIDAAPGEEVLLVHYEHHTAASPFRASHAIYVRRDAEQAMLPKDTVPDLFRPRMLSLRAFDRDGMMIMADLSEGTLVEKLIAVMFGDPAVDYIHAHYAKAGCYAARIDRA